MRKPAHQWETRRHRALRKPEPPGREWEQDGRAEEFELEFDDGRVGRAVLGLEHQLVDQQSLDDPDLLYAVQAWLIARGIRTINLRDSAGRVVATGAISVADLSEPQPSGKPLRLITLAPSNAEMVDALGCFDRVIACEDSSDWPKGVGALERLGPDLGPDLDRVVELRPDLVVTSLSVPGMERVVSGVRARGLRQRVLAPRSFEDVIAELSSLGESLGVPERAAEVAARLRAERLELEDARPQRRVRVYLEWWPKPMYTPGADCYSNELIDLAGGENVFRGRAGSSIEVTAADVVRADPEICFVSWCGVTEDKLDTDNLVTRSGLEKLESARHGRVYPLDERFSGRPGPRMLEASRRMAKAMEAAGLRA